ncbi:MAG: PaaI family thioesterase [Pseudonocardiaceae bacterium]|nr:PaaI family thioesterase [Pseudonocardiaceae bacterium]
MGPHYARCFACGDDPPGGLRMQFTAGEAMTVTSRFLVTEHHQGAPGLAHGGILTCAIDEALGALGPLLRVPMVTGRLETDFRRPVPVGTTLHIEARIDGRSGRKIHVSADGHLDAPDGPVAVRSRALYLAVPVEHFGTHGRAEDVEAARADPGLRADRHFDVNP